MAVDRRLSGHQAGLVAGVVAVASAAAAGDLHRVFGAGTVVGPVLIGTAVGVGAALVGWIRRWPGAVSAVPAIAALVAVAPVMGLGDGAVAGVVPTPSTVVDLWDAVVNGWDRVLTSPLPAPDEPSMVVLVGVVAVALSWVGAELALRLAPGWGIVPPIAGFALVSTLSVPVGGSRAVPMVVLGIAGSVLLAGPGRAGPAPARRTVGARPAAGRGARAVVVGLAALAIGLVAGPDLTAVGGREAVDPRPEQPVPEEVVVAVNPLARLAGWAQEPDEVLLRARLSTAAPVRIATLDSFDGTTWRTSGTLRRAGTQIQVAPSGRERVEQEVEVVGLDGSWVPAAETPVTFDGPSAWFDEATGTLSARRAEGLARGTRYTVTSAVSRATADDAAAAPVDGSRPELLAVPGVPSTVSGLARQAVAGATTPFARALVLEDWIRRRADFDPEAPSGHSWATIRFFLEEPEDAGGRRGTSEQFATSFAVMARTLGLPTRVVVGFPQVPAGPDAATLAAGDVRAWPEVRFAGVGWIAFDPTPSVGEDLPEVPPPSTTAPTEGPVPTIDLTGAGSTEEGGDGRRPRRPAEPTAGPPVVVVAAVALVLLVLVVAVAPVVKAVRRRRRRRSGSPRARVLGAWDELVDRLRDGGIGVTPDLTRTDVVDAASRAGVDGERLLPLRDLANRAGFSGGELGAEEAEGAWLAVDVAGRELARSMGPSRRLRAGLDPRSLRRPAA